MSEREPSHRHKWASNMVDWGRREPAQSREVTVAAYCEICSLEANFRYEFIEAESPDGEMLEVEPDA